MKPTIGRIVHYYQELPTGRGVDVQPNAAIITRLNAGGTVNLCVFHSGLSSSPSGNAQSVGFGDPAEDKTGKLWCWPPRETSPDGSAISTTGEVASTNAEAKTEAATAGSADRDEGEPGAAASPST